MIYELNHYVPTIISQGHVVLMCFFSFQVSKVWDSSRENLILSHANNKAQTSLRIHADWSAPMLFAFWKNPATLALSKMSIVLPVSIAEKIGPSLTWSGTPKTFFLASRPLFKNDPERTCLKVIFNGTALSCVCNGSSWRQGCKIFEPCCQQAPRQECVRKIICLISQPKHLLWVLKRTVSLWRFLWAPKTHV